MPDRIAIPTSSPRPPVTPAPAEALRITLSGSEAPGLERLQESCAIGGHWVVHDHHLAARSMPDLALLYCVAGKGWVRVGPRRLAIIAGDLFFCPPQIEHGYGCEPQSGWEIWWCHLRGTQAVKLCAQAGLSESQPVVRPPEPTALVARFAALVERLARPDALLPWEAALLAHGILVELIRQEADLPTTRELAGVADMTAESLAELAARAGYSKYHFARRFKQQTGRSPWQYVLERKMERARELLLGSRLSVKEIAAELGFEHADYFAKLFRKHAGLTPKAYRGRESSAPPTGR